MMNEGEAGQVDNDNDNDSHRRHVPCEAAFDSPNASRLSKVAIRTARTLDAPRAVLETLQGHDDGAITVLLGVLILLRFPLLAHRSWQSGDGSFKLDVHAALDLSVGVVVTVGLAGIVVVVGLFLVLGHLDDLEAGGTVQGNFFNASSPPPPSLLPRLLYRCRVLHQLGTERINQRATLRTRVCAVTVAIAIAIASSIAIAIASANVWKSCHGHAAAYSCRGADGIAGGFME